MSIFICEGCGDYVDSDYDIPVEISGALFCERCQIDMNLVEDEPVMEAVERELSLMAAEDYLKMRRNIEDE